MEGAIQIYLNMTVENKFQRRAMDPDNISKSGKSFGCAAGIFME